MNNTIDIQTDGVNIYVNMKVKISRTLKTISIILVLIPALALIFILSSFKGEVLGKVLIPTIALFLFFIFIPGRFLFWNLFGEELMIINTKTISYAYNFGIIKTQLKTIDYTQLGIGFKLVRIENGLEKGNLLFYNYLKQNNLPVLIHKTSVLIEQERLKHIESELKKIFLDEFNQQYGFIGFSEN